MVLPASLGPLLRARTFVLVGDHNQLPPLVTCKEAEQGGLGDSLFKRLSEAHPKAVVSLPVQYRMAADIMALPNALIYGDALRCGTGGWLGGLGGCECEGCNSGGRGGVEVTGRCRAWLWR